MQMDLIVLAVMPAAVAKSEHGIRLLPPELSSIANLVPSFPLTDYGTGRKALQGCVKAQTRASAP